MNIDLLFTTLAGDLAQMGQTVSPAEPGQEGQEFEDMLLQQSKAAQAKRKDEMNSKKPEKKEDPEKPEDTSTQEEEITEEGGELAAALVTSQPVVSFAVFNTGEIQASEEGNVVPEAAGLADAPQQLAENAPMADGNLNAVPEQQAQPEETGFQPQTIETQPEQQAPQQEAPAVQAEETQPELTVQQEEQPKVEARQTQAQPEEKSGEETQDAEMLPESRPLFQEVKAAPVKVGEAQQPVEVEKPEAPQQLAGQLAQAIDQGESMVRIQLNPANLGNLTIEIARDEAGVLTIVMHPETAKAAQLLQQHSGALIHALWDEGKPAVSVMVTMPEENQNAGMFLNPDGHNRQDQEEDDERKKRKSQNRTESVSAADFLSQLRLGLIDMENAKL